MTASARMEVSFPLKDLIEANLDAPEGSQWRTEPLGSDVVTDRPISRLGRALRWANDMDDRIETALVEFGCHHEDSGTGFGSRDIGYSLNPEQHDEARQRLSDLMAANSAVPADTAISITVYADDSFEEELHSWSTTVGEYRASLAPGN